MPVATLTAAVESRVEIKKSVFWGLVTPVDSVADADAILARVKKEHYAARHHCTALIIDQEVQRSNDDGEPGGSAGAPMLAVLRHHQLINVFAVVTRYFGGTLLGVGGLIRAYTSAVNEALALGDIRTVIPQSSFQVICPLAMVGAFENGLRVWAAGHDARIDDVSYATDVTFTLTFPSAHRDAFEVLLSSWISKGVRWE